MNRILLVEDHDSIVRGLAYFLERENFQVVTAKNVSEAKRKIEEMPFDLALLDIMLPDGTGYEVCRELRLLRPETPVIFLTAKDGENEVVYGFNLGAEDYVAKAQGASNAGRFLVVGADGDVTLAEIAGAGGVSF